MELGGLVGRGRGASDGAEGLGWSWEGLKAGYVVVL